MKKYNTTLGELFNTRQAIINKDIVNMAFSRKGGLSVARNMKKIDDELVEYSKARNELIRKYSSDGVTMERSSHIGMRSSRSLTNLVLSKHRLRSTQSPSSICRTQSHRQHALQLNS